MAVTRLRAAAIGPVPAAVAEGEIMAEATLAEISPGQANLGTIVARSAQRYGPKPALVAGRRTLTYQALGDLCDRVAGGLRELGVRPGDRVLLYSPNRWEWAVAYHAACGPAPWSTRST